MTPRNSIFGLQCVKVYGFFIMLFTLFQAWIAKDKEVKETVT